MLALIAGVAWAGYTLVTYGQHQLRGCVNVGLVDLVVPGRYNGCTKPAPSTDPGPDASLQPAPGAGPAGKQPGAGGQSPVSPPSTEGYMSRVPK